MRSRTHWQVQSFACRLYRRLDLHTHEPLLSATPPKPLDAPQADSMPRRQVPWWLWPHVLSLEAPLVAVLWQAALMRMHGVHSTPGVGLGLGLACWVIYVLDRTLDTLGVNEVQELDVRHAFYFRHRRVILALGLPLACGVLAWLALWVIPQGLLWQAVGLLLLVALYLANWSAQGSRVSRDLLTMLAGLGAVLLVSRLPASSGFRFVLSSMILGVMLLTFLRQLDTRLGQLLSKETSAALLFAMGCTTGVRFFSMPETLLDPIVECLLLGLLFACNLHGLAAREQRDRGIPSTPTLLPGLTVMACMVVQESVRARLLQPALSSLGHLVLAALLLFGLLEVFGRRLSRDAYHVLVDLLLVLPLLWLWF